MRVLIELSSKSEMQTKKNLALFIVPLVVAICSVILLIIYLQVYWANHPRRNGGGYCEISTQGLLAEPLNTWSNLSFIGIGLIIAWQMMCGSFRDKVNILTTNDFMAIFFASLVICLGPASMVMHAVYTNLGVELDILSEYLICGYLMGYSTQRFFRLHIRYFVIIFLLVIVICEVVMRWQVPIPIVEGLTNLLVGIFLILSILMELLIMFVRRVKIQKWWGITSIVTFIFSFLIWNFSRNGNALCDPYSWFQGHAVWHALDALALYFLFRYYTSENAVERSAPLEKSPYLF